MGIVAGAVDAPSSRWRRLLFALIGLGGAGSSVSSAMLRCSARSQRHEERHLAWWQISSPSTLLRHVDPRPQAMQKAKQMAGVQQPARRIVAYVFLWLYAAAADLNDIAKAMLAGA